MRRVRVVPVPRVKVVPRLNVVWTGTFEGYARRWVDKHYWRVAATVGSKEDALQECALIWARCKRHYEGRVDNHAWFMSLYKVALVNDWNTMSVRTSRSRDVCLLMSPELAETMEGDKAMVMVDYNHGPKNLSISELSRDLVQVLDLLVDAPSELLEWLFSDVSTLVTNRRIRRWAGIRSGSGDILSQLREALS